MFITKKTHVLYSWSNNLKFHFGDFELNAELTVVSVHVYEDSWTCSRPSASRTKMAIPRSSQNSSDLILPSWLHQTCDAGVERTPSPPGDSIKIHAHPIHPIPIKVNPSHPQKIFHFNSSIYLVQETYTNIHGISGLWLWSSKGMITTGYLQVRVYSSNCSKQKGALFHLFHLWLYLVLQKSQHMDVHWKA